MFFGDTGTALQAVATCYARAPEGSGGLLLSKSRRVAYLDAMLSYYNYVTKGCVQPPAIPGFAYGSTCPPAAALTERLLDRPLGRLLGLDACAVLWREYFSS